MNNHILSISGPLVCHSVRLHRGDDLLLSIREIAKNKNIHAAVVLSAVGCISEGRVRDASGVTIREIKDHCEIVSLNGTVSAARCHLHISFAREDLSVIGGHLLPGCIVNTTAEIVLGEVDGIIFDKVFDPETGYHELEIQRIAETT